MDISEYQAYEGVCPRCNAIWGMDEIDTNHCFACGYPNENEFDSDYEDYEDYIDRTCPECGGSGGDRWNDGVVPCKVCFGSGIVDL